MRAAPNEVIPAALDGAGGGGRKLFPSLAVPLDFVFEKPPRDISHP